jgi:molybdopterin-synthase adenylyltransferase
MKNSLKKSLLERFSRQIILKDIGLIGQKKIISSKILIIGVGGLGCPVAEFLARAGIGTIGIVDNDKVNLSNLHRQSLYHSMDIGKSKVFVVKNKIKLINSKTKVKIYRFRLNKINFEKIINDYDLIIDGSDNFETKFLLNDFCLKHKKFLITGAISKFDGHIFTFDFNNKKTPCLRCFFQESEISEDPINCESEGILGTVAGIVGTIQANEALKRVLNIGKNLNGYILILDFLNLNFRKIKLIKLKKCLCK